MASIGELRDKLHHEIHQGVVNAAAMKVLSGRRIFQARRAGRNHKAQKKAERKAHNLRANGHKQRADWQEAKAARCEHRAIKSHKRAQELIKRLKDRNLRQDHIQAAIKDFERAIAQWERQHGPHVVENSPDRAEGGSDRERVVFCAKQALGHGRYYSQAGGWTVNYCWTPIPYGNRSDCSQWILCTDHAAGLPSSDGNYNDGGWTGSLADACIPIPMGNLQPGDLVIYFAGWSSHHVERYVGGGLTIGHGDSAINYGTPNMMSGARAYRPRALA